MRAIRMTKFGAPEVLEAVEVPNPIARSGEVVIEVEFANITFIDTQFRASGFGPFGADLPVVPGNGIGGVVASVGGDVDEAWIGRRVVAITGISEGYAERAVVPEKEAIAVPDGLALDEATALINDGRTALALIEEANVRPGEWTLIMPAGSGLGLLLVQFARAAGARVIASARGGKKLVLARESGAEIAVDYTESNWIEHVREEIGGAGVDVVLDGVGGDVGRAAFGATASGGKFAAFGDSSGSYLEYDENEARERGITVIRAELVHIGGTEKARRLAEKALAEAESGSIIPHIGQRFALEEAAKAHEALEARKTTGRTLLMVKSSSPFTKTELEFLDSQLIGRLATIQPNGTLQNSPVGFRYNPEAVTIDIGGYDMAKSRKYKNVVENGQVAFVVDDVLSTNPWRVRCLEIRGRAEGVETSGEPFIRVHPERIISFGIDEPDKDPHELTPNIRDATEPPERGARN